MRHSKFFAVVSILIVGYAAFLLFPKLDRTISIDDKRALENMPASSESAHKLHTVVQSPVQKKLPQVNSQLLFTEASLPKIDLPLINSIGELRRSAESGNYLAGCRLAAELMQCMVFEYTKKQLQNQQLALTDIPVTDASHEATKLSIATIEQSLQKDNRLCSGFSNPDNLEPWRYLFQAAVAGHLPSKAAFVLSPPIDPNEMFKNSEFFDAYKNQAGTFLIDAANGGVRQAVNALGWAYLGDEVKSVFKPGFGLNLVEKDYQKSAIYLYASYAFPALEPAQTNTKDSLKLRLEKLLTPEQIAIAKVTASALVSKWPVETVDWIPRANAQKKMMEKYNSPSTYLCEG
jgi:hypothetical protein